MNKIEKQATLQLHVQMQSTKKAEELVYTLYRRTNDIYQPLSGNAESDPYRGKVELGMGNQSEITIDMKVYEIMHDEDIFLGVTALTWDVFHAHAEKIAEWIGPAKRVFIPGETVVLK